MHAKTAVAVGSLMLSPLAAAAKHAKRDSWGAAFSLGPAKADIISTTTTIYPGKPPSTQDGYLFAWLGISNGTGDLIQSIIGSYPLGQSECSDYTLSTWCISSEVYGDTSAGVPNQWVGDLTTADANYENGIILNYTLIDKSSYLWLQTMTDAVTGELLSTFNKTSGPMDGWGTANECDDDDGVACTGTVSEQIWVNSTIILESADDSFSDTLGVGTGVVYTDMETADGGITWTISKITIPAMTNDTDSSSSSSVAASSIAAATSSVRSYSTQAAAAVVQSSEASAPAFTPVKSAYSAPGFATYTPTTFVTAAFTRAAGGAGSHTRGGAGAGFASAATPTGAGQAQTPGPCRGGDGMPGHY